MFNYHISAFHSRRAAGACVNRSAIAERNPQRRQGPEGPEGPEGGRTSQNFFYLAGQGVNIKAEVLVAYFANGEQTSRLSSVLGACCWNHRLRPRPTRRG